MAPALSMQQDERVLISALARLFVCGRITFWIGYVLHPLARLRDGADGAADHRRLRVARVACMASTRRMKLVVRD